MVGGFPTQRASNTENVSIWWRHHAKSIAKNLFVHTFLPSFLVNESFCNFVQSTAYILPCSVQNFRRIDWLEWMLSINKVLWYFSWRLHGFGCYRPQVTIAPNHGKLTFIGFCLKWHRETMGDPLVVYHTVHITIDRMMPCGVMLCMRPANERRRYNVTSFSLAGCMHIVNTDAWTKWLIISHISDMSHTFQAHFLERKLKQFDSNLIIFWSLTCQLTTAQHQSR